MNNPELSTVLEARGLSKSYRQGSEVLQVLNGLDFAVTRGECVAIVGSSGSGKSTLLNLLGGLDEPDAGSVFLQTHSLTDCSANERSLLRNRHLGFVYQFHHLLPEFSAVENVFMPLLIGGMRQASARDKAMQLLDRVGLQQRYRHRPAELSGGERQRVAIARALACDPGCVLMDEPTGNLDRKNAEAIHALMRDLNHNLATSFVVVTHDEHLARQMDRVLHLEQGRLVPEMASHAS